MRDKGEQLVEDALAEMFDRVGETYPNKKLTDQPGWYTMRSWTDEEEQDFREWLTKKIKKAWPYLTEKKVAMEVAMFLLQWGWKTTLKHKCLTPRKRKAKK